jgi:hypothetical protein
LGPTSVSGASCHLDMARTNDTPYSITSSARAITDDGTLCPSALAVLSWLLYGLLRHGRRRIMWIGVTAHPTAEWIAPKSRRAAAGRPCRLNWFVIGTGSTRGIYLTHSSDGHSRQTDSAAISLAERRRRTTDRLDQTRMPESRDHNWRATPTPYPAFVPAILQRHQNTSRVGQRLTANEACPGGRSHSFAADPRRIAPSLYPDLISDSDNYQA